MIAGLKPYPAYKDSGVEWLTEVPEGWEVRRLKHVTDQVVGGATPNADRSDYWGGGIVWVTPEDIVPFSPLTKSERTLTKAGLEACSATLLPAGAIILTSRAPVGNVTISAVSAATNQGCKAIVVDADALRAEYLLAVLGTMRPEIESWASGTTFAEISTNRVGELRIPIPPDEDQLAITRFLDYVDSRIQRVIKAREALIGLAEERKRAAIHSAVARGLDPNVPLKPSGIDWLGDVPKHWEIVPLKALATEIVNGATPPPAHRSYYEGGSIPWFGPSSLASEDVLGPPSRFLSEAAFATGKARRVKAPALLVTVIGATAGRMGLLLEDAATNQQITAFTIRDELIEPDVLVAQLSFARSWLRKTAPAATIPIIDSALLKRLPVVVPALAEQLALAQLVGAARESNARVVARAESHVTLLREFRTRLISDVVTGKLDVREAAAKLPDDPDADDPALEERLEEVAAG